jgi:two-component system NtrC family sensor kinase
LFIDSALRLRATFFIKFLIVVNILAALALLILPNSIYTVGISVVVHIFLAVILCWFLIKVVWPVRNGIDELVQAVTRHQPGNNTGIPANDAVNMGSYVKVISQTVTLLDKQYSELTAHTQQLENFSQVLERQNHKIRESRQRYRKTLDALKDGLYLIDDNYIVQTINRAEAEFFSSTPKELVGKYCYEVFRHRNSPCSDCLPRKCLADGRNRSRLRVPRHRAGREFINIFCYPIFLEGESEKREVVICIQDSSQLVIMEDQVVRTEKMASIGQMAAGIAHDLNNYLAGIFGVVQLLQMRFEVASEDRSKDLKLMGRLKDQVEALNLMAGNLMVFSYPERKEMFPLSLNQVIKDALSFSRYELERDEVSVVCDFKENMPSAQLGKGQIQQVVLNLMLNAAQAIRECKADSEESFAGKIVVATGIENEESIFFSITDNGTGITPECQKNLFDPFFSTKSVKAEKGATGLGLFTANTIVAQHQGSISFQSEPGQGSCFKVVLPLRQETKPSL